MDETVKTGEEKHGTVVEYTLCKLIARIGVASYSIHDEPPKGYEKYLPSQEEISRKPDKLLEWVLLKLRKRDFEQDSP